VLEQLHRDPRTLGLVFVVPPGLLALLHYLFEANAGSFQRIGTPLIGLFPLTVMFLVTSIAVLRERTSGTLERLMSLPIGRLDLLLGYGLAFALVAMLQALITAGVGYGVLGISTVGSPAWVILFAVCNAVLGTALGLFLSAFASSEFQAVQFMPAFLFPQILLSGLFVPRGHMPDALRLISDFLPVSYAYEGLARVGAGAVSAALSRDLPIVAAFIVASLGLGALTLRRRTP
jgi:ABC-2 type transport system permease protein